MEEDLGFDTFVESSWKSSFREGSENELLWEITYVLSEFQTWNLGWEENVMGVKIPNTPTLNDMMAFYRQLSIKIRSVNATLMYVEYVHISNVSSFFFIHIYHYIHSRRGANYNNIGMAIFEEKPSQNFDMILYDTQADGTKVIATFILAGKKDAKRIDNRIELDDVIGFRWAIDFEAAEDANMVLSYASVGKWMIWYKLVGMILCWGCRIRIVAITLYLLEVNQKYLSVSVYILNITVIQSEIK